MSHLRKPNESDVEFARRRILETGQLWGKENPDGPNVGPKDVAKLQPNDSAFKQGITGLAKMMIRDYAPLFVAKTRSAAPAFDGELDSAILSVMSLPRCDVPDYAPPPGAKFLLEDPRVQEVAERMQRDYALPALGPGNWPSCHNIGKFHCALIRVNLKTKPTWFTDALFKRVVANNVKAYDGVGCHLIYVDQNMKDILTGEDRTGQHVDIESSWTQLSGNAIGLAIVGNDIDCIQNIWQEFDPDYKGGTTDDAIVQQQSSLHRHETGHNHGLGHFNGWTMNPSIVNGLPVDVWSPSDPARATLDVKYGGEPYVAGSPPPGPPPGPTDPVEKRLAALEKAQFEDNIKNALQDARDQLFDARLKKLESRP